METTHIDRVINLNTELVVSESDWALNYGVEGGDQIEADVRRWARNVLTEALRASGIKGVAR